MLRRLTSKHSCRCVDAAQKARFRLPWRSTLDSSGSCRRLRTTSATGPSVSRLWPRYSSNETSRENASSLIDRLIAAHGPASIVAPADFNRWLVPPAAISFHLCLGAVYAWSILNAPLANALGVVGAAAADWTLGNVVPIFSTAIFFLGASSAIAGRHLDRFGPRIFGLASMALWAGGHVVSAVGVQTHCLPLLYLGYGVMGGIGLGLGYLAPVALLMSWFPDRRGMAAGMAIMGFGGGAIIFTPVMQAAIRHFQRSPVYVGALDAPGQTIASGGIRHLIIDGQQTEVLAAFAKDLVKFPGLHEGLYVVGSGDIGLASTLACCGLGYAGVMTIGAMTWRTPAPGWNPDGTTARAKSAGAPALHGVPVDVAMRTPQFRYLWLNLCLNTTAGIGMIACAKDMMGEIFGNALPTVVTPEFAASYVLAVSLANMGGRFFWATISDSIGRKNAYYTYFGLGVPLYLSLPCWASMTTTDPFLALCLFYASTMVTFSTYGAGFSTMPPYVADVFGPKDTSAIFGRVLTAWSAAGILGPLAITQLRARAQNRAAAELAVQIGDERFQACFNAPIADLDCLLSSKAVTLQRLLEVAPAGTLDPTPYLYNDVMFTMAAIQALAILSNCRIQPHVALLQTPLGVEQPRNTRQTDKECARG